MESKELDHLQGPFQADSLMRLRDQSLRSRRRPDSDPYALKCFGVQCEGQVISHGPQSLKEKEFDVQTSVRLSAPGSDMILLPSPFLTLTCTSLPEETKLSELQPSPMEGGEGEASP